MGPMWDVLTLIHRGLDHGQPDVFFCRYVDTDVKDDPSDVWYNLMNSIISIFILMATSFIRLPS